MTSSPNIAGYDYGRVPRSPVSLEDLRRLEVTVGLTDDDRASLARARDILAGKAEALVDGWRDIIGSHDFLAHWFVGPDGKPDDDYKAAVKPRFVRWVIDLLTRPFDQSWLDYQHEIGLRHTPVKKNSTDHAQTPPVVPLRYLLAFAVPVMQAPRTLFEANGVSPEELERMHVAWTKAVMLTLTLWTLPYTKEGLW